MKKLLLLVPVLAMLTACGTTRDSYERRADAEREVRMQSQEKVLNKMPDWCINTPTSNNAVYACGIGSSFAVQDSDAYAKNDAYGKICMTAGGKTAQQTKTYSTEGENSRAQFNERLTKSYCPSVDLTGVERRDVKRFVTPNGKVNTFVLIALPTGDANILRRAKEQARMNEIAAKRAPEAFKELE